MATPPTLNTTQVQALLVALSAEHPLSPTWRSVRTAVTALNDAVQGVTDNTRYAQELVGEVETYDDTVLTGRVDDLDEGFVGLSEAIGTAQSDINDINGTLSSIASTLSAIDVKLEYLLGLHSGAEWPPP